jgi:hypothetical protein
MIAVTTQLMFLYVLTMVIRMGAGIWSVMVLASAGKPVLRWRQDGDGDGDVARIKPLQGLLHYKPQPIRLLVASSAHLTLFQSPLQHITPTRFVKLGGKQSNRLRLPRTHSLYQLGAGQHTAPSLSSVVAVGHIGPHSDVPLHQRDGAG